MAAGIKRFGDFVWQALQLRDIILVIRLRHDAELFRDIDRQQIDHGKLRTVALRRRHGDLRPRPGVKHVVGFVRDGAADDVHDGNDAGAEALRLPQRGERVGRFAGLADDEDEDAVVDDRVAVAEFGSDVHFNGDMGLALEQIFRDDADVIGGAAGDDENFADVFEFFLCQAYAVEDDPAVPDAWGDRVAHGLGLLHDLLGHEVVVTALFRRGNVPVDMGRFLLHRVQVHVVDRDSAFPDLGELVFLKTVDIPRAPQDRRNVGRDEILPVAEADDQRAFLADSDHAVRVIAAKDAQRVGAADFAERFHDGAEQVAFVIIVQKLSDDLRIRFGDEMAAMLREKAFQSKVVFNHAVVHNRKLSGFARLRMRVDVGRLAVRRPASMADTDGARHIRAAVNLVAEDLQSPLRFHHPDRSAVVNGDARGVVAAVFQLFKAF